MFMKSLTACAIAASLVGSGPAVAQYMPHLDPNLYMLATMNMNQGPNTCLTGSSPPEREIDEARLPAPGVMQAYFDAAQAGTARGHMFRKSDKSQWSRGATTVPIAQIDSQSDPLAVAGNRLDPEPLRFFRAGNFQTAHGQWSVMDGAGSVAGVYDALFKRQGGEWKLQNLTVLEANAVVKPAMQYCIEPGDVAANKVEASTTWLEYVEKEIAKSEEKLVRERGRLEKAEANLAERPDRAGNREAVRREKKVVENREKKLEELRKNLEDAQKGLVNANRDVAEIAAMTLPARDALRLRGFELTTAKEAAEKKAADEAKAN